MRLPRNPPTAAPITVPASRLPALPPIALPINPPATAPTAVPPTSFGPESAEQPAALTPINATATKLLIDISPPMAGGTVSMSGADATDQKGSLGQNSVDGAAAGGRPSAPAVPWRLRHALAKFRGPIPPDFCEQEQDAEKIYADLGAGLGAGAYRLLRANLTRPGLSGPDGEARGAVPGRRHRRRHATHHRRLAVAQMGPVGDYREPRRRR